MRFGHLWLRKWNAYRAIPVGHRQMRLNGHVNVSPFTEQSRNTHINTHRPALRTAYTQITQQILNKYFYIDMYRRWKLVILKRAHPNWWQFIITSRRNAICFFKTEWTPVFSFIYINMINDYCWILIILGSLWPLCVPTASKQVLFLLISLYLFLFQFSSTLFATISKIFDSCACCTILRNSYTITQNFDFQYNSHAILSFAQVNYSYGMCESVNKHLKSY